MSDRSIILRTAAHVLLALLFAVAAVAFGQRAMEAWNANVSVRLWVFILASLGAVSLSANSLRRARAIATGPDLGRSGAPPA